MKEIKSKVQKLANVKWRELKPIQQENFKELTKEAYKKLRQSLLNNDFISPFAVWQEKGGAIYTIDGVHRQKVLLELEHEGYEIPPTLPAVFIDCANRKDAAKMLLVYSSAYARTTDEGLYEFLNMEGLNFDELKLEIDIPSIDERYFINPDNFGEDFSLKDGDRQPIQQMTFTLADRQAEEIKNALKIAPVGKTFGNQNSNGNALFAIVAEWAAQKK